MKCLILFLFSGVLAQLPVTTVVPVLMPETLTDLPQAAIEDFGAVTERPRENEIEAEKEIKAEEVSTVSYVDEGTSTSTVAATTTAHFTQLACTDENMEWNSCGPRCYQTCAFQPRATQRRSRAVCETMTASGCHAACFCKSGYVRLNDKCVLPMDCPSKLELNLKKLKKIRK